MLQALEEALEEKAEIESKMLRDASRESQLLDDFEWKLGEIERDYKKKLVEAEKSAEERFKNEMAIEYQKLVDDKRDIDAKLTEVRNMPFKKLFDYLYLIANLFPNIADCSPQEFRS